MCGKKFICSNCPGDGWHGDGMAQLGHIDLHCENGATLNCHYWAEEALFHWDGGAVGRAQWHGRCGL